MSQNEISLNSGQIAVNFINNEGGGYSGMIAVDQGTTVHQLFAQKMRSGSNPSNFIIRVNRQPADANQVLNSGDLVSITPTKIQGAADEISLNSGQIAVNFINNEGGGYSGMIAVDSGTTVHQLFAQKMRSGSNPSNFIIRVNRQPADANQVLNSGDLVSITPTKIQGA